MVKAATFWVAEQIGSTKTDYMGKINLDENAELKEMQLRQDINLLTRDLKEELRSKKKENMKELCDKYRVKKKQFKTVIEELKQTMLAKNAKEKRYEERIELFKKNKIFDLDQEKIYAELKRNGIRSNDVPNVEECTTFWSNIWGL